MIKRDFDAFYSDIESSDLTKIWEEANKERCKGNKIAASIIAIIDGLIIAIILANISNIKNGMFYAFSFVYAVMAMLIVDVIIYSVCRAIFSKSYSKYNEVFKGKVIDCLLNNFFEDVEYVPKKEMPESIYNEGNYEKYDKYLSDDYMHGKIENKYEIKMADIITKERREETDSDGTTRTYYVTKFWGLFAKICLDKGINNTLRIQENSLLRKSKVDMDHSDFEKCFDVFCSDKIFTMQVLTHDVMEKLLDYRVKLKKYFDIYIKDNAMYIRVHTGQMFEARLDKTSVLNKETVKNYFDVVEFVYSMAKYIIKDVESVKL